MAGPSDEPSNTIDGGSRQPSEPPERATESMPAEPPEAGEVPHGTSASAAVVEPGGPDPGPSPSPDESPPPASGPPVAWGSPPPAAEQGAGPAGWIPPAGGGGGRSRGCGIVAIIAALVFGFGSFALAALIVLGSQVQSILKGTIEFGTGGSSCNVTGVATSFPSSASIHYAAWLSRQVTAGERLTIVVTFPDGTSQSVDQAVNNSADCIYDDIQPGNPAGHYVIAYRSSAELLAQGAIDIQP